MSITIDTLRPARLRLGFRAVSLSVEEVQNIAAEVQVQGYVLQALALALEQSHLISIKIVLPLVFDIKLGAVAVAVAVAVAGTPFAFEIHVCSNSNLLAEDDGLMNILKTKRTRKAKAREPHSEYLQN